MVPGGYFPGEIQPMEEGGEVATRDLGRRVRLPGSLSWSSVGSDPAVNCRVAVLPE